MWSTTFLPPGKYYIGDLGHVLDIEEWDELTAKQGIIKDLAIFTTTFGDGLYKTNLNKKRISVDSGTIGCIQIVDIKEENHHETKEGVVHTFTKKFRCGMADDTIHFGTVRVFQCDDDE